MTTEKWTGHHTGGKLGLVTDDNADDACVATICFGRGETEKHHRHIDLIAAAPTMLATLCEIRDALTEARRAMGCLSDYCNGCCHFCANIRRANAAIETAEGRPTQ